MQKISVLMPVFNRELYLVKAVKSLFNQTYQNWELIIYDDGSTDNSVKFIERCMKKDTRIRLIKGDKNRGVAYARNKLLEACNTKYACWQDSDDISSSKRIELQVDEIRDDNPIIFCNWTWITFSKTKNKWVKRAKASNHDAFATLLFPVDKEIRFNDALKIGGEDWTWIKEMQKKYPTFAIDKILYKVRAHNDRIGAWKRKFRRDIPKEILGKLSYAELIEYYKENHG